jgi:4-amino-4-deoxy-L-arabinose transferase-like glycosyltransferase
MRKRLMDSNTHIFFRENWHWIALALIAALSFWLNFHAVSNIGYGNAYYAAAVKSMTQSFKNFFYVSFDPAGMVSVDKPPLGLWVQVLFIRVFGYAGWVLLLPQALSGTGSAVMMYVLTARYFGRTAGLVSALCFALTPAVVVASRNNTMDMQLVFVLLAAAWFLLKAVEKAKWRYLFLCALCIGIGFNIKMMQAYMILPAVAAVYLVFSKEKFSRRLIACGVSLLILAGVSFAWVAAVDLTPASERPYVDSSSNNSIWELIVEHNGLERVLGYGLSAANAGGGQADGQMDGVNGAQPFIPGQNRTGNAPFPGNQGGPDGIMPGRDGGGSGGTGATGGRQDGVAGNEIGTAGIFRLWTDSVYGQASWLIVFAFFCIAAKLRRFNLKNLTPRGAVTVFWAVWLIAMCLFFSFAGFWHRYYLCMLAPAVAGLAGPGIVRMARAFGEKTGWKRFLLPAAFAATLAVEAVYVFRYEELRGWLVPLMAGTAAAAFLLMALNCRKPKNFFLTRLCCLDPGVRSGGPVLLVLDGRPVSAAEYHHALCGTGTCFK